MNLYSQNRRAAARQMLTMTFLYSSDLGEQVLVWMLGVQASQQFRPTGRGRPNLLAACHPIPETLNPKP